MPNPESAKERYLFEALKLFGERGYASVRMTDLAKAVGCVPSALYKHYESKQELYDTIIAESVRGFDAGMERMRVDFGKHPEQKEKYIAMTEDEQIQMVKDLFLYTLHNEWVAAFRKLMTVEQFKDKTLARMYDDRYVRFQYEQHAALFQILMDAGKLKRADPYTLAVLYISPMTVFIGMCDRDPEQEELALRLIENHVREFNKTYRIYRKARN